MYDFRQMVGIAMEQSAVDCSCQARAFRVPDNSMHISVADPMARRDLELPQICTLVSYGKGIVGCGRAELVPAVQTWLQKISPGWTAFETPEIYGLNEILFRAGAQVACMAEYWLPDPERLKDVEDGLVVMEPESLASFYDAAWGNALCADRRELDVLAVGAYEDERLIGLAGCSADCASMWQIGVDVLPECRGRGIGSALTRRLAIETLKRGKVPFYCCGWSNLGSARNAIRSGFRPVWTEIRAQPDSVIESMMK